MRDQELSGVSNKQLPIFLIFSGNFLLAACILIIGELFAKISSCRGLLNLAFDLEVHIICGAIDVHHANDTGRLDERSH